MVSGKWGTGDAASVPVSLLSIHGRPHPRAMAASQTDAFPLIRAPEHRNNDCGGRVGTIVVNPETPALLSVDTWLMGHCQDPLDCGRATRLAPGASSTEAIREG